LKEDVLHRLVDIWATGEAATSLGFAAARLFDELDPLERRKEEIFAEQGIGGAPRLQGECVVIRRKALDCLQNSVNCDDPMVRYVSLDSLANVICPACKPGTPATAPT